MTWETTQVGKAVLVCDCGGGTVVSDYTPDSVVFFKYISWPNAGGSQDLASYKIARDFPRLELNQACVSEGTMTDSIT